MSAATALSPPKRLSGTGHRRRLGATRRASLFVASRKYATSIGLEHTSTRDNCLTHRHAREHEVGEPRNITDQASAASVPRRRRVRLRDRLHVTSGHSGTGTSDLRCIRDRQGAYAVIARDLRHASWRLRAHRLRKEPRLTRGIRRDHSDLSCRGVAQHPTV